MHRILDALFKVFEREGSKVEEDDRHQLFVTLKGERIPFRLRGKMKKVRRLLTAEKSAGALAAIRTGNRSPTFHW